MSKADDSGPITPAKRIKERMFQTCGRAEKGRAARADDQRQGLARLHDGAAEQGIAGLAGIARGNDASPLLDRIGLTRQGRLTGGEGHRLEHQRVGRDDVAGPHPDDVAWHDGLDLDRHESAIVFDLGLERHRATQDVGRLDSAAFLEVSRPIESTRITTMTAPLMASPVTADTMPAARRIRDSGSSSRRTTASATLACLGTASALAPYCLRRATASIAPGPAVPQPNSAQSASSPLTQKGARASGTIMCGVGHANSGHAAAHGGYGLASPARLESDHRLAIEGHRLAGELGDKIEAQDHGSALLHGIEHALRQLREHLLRLIGEHGIVVGEQKPDRKDAAVDRDLGARVALEVLRRDALRQQRALRRQIDLELQDPTVARFLASQHDAVDVEIGALRIDHCIARRVDTLLGLPTLELARGAGKGWNYAETYQDQRQAHRPMETTHCPIPFSRFGQARRRSLWSG